MSKSVSTFRIRLISGIIIAIACVLVIKLYMVQVVYSERFEERADRQYLKPQHNVLERGSVAFTRRDGTTIDAATVKTGYTLALNPTILTQPEDTYNALSFVIDLDADEFLEKANKKDDPYEEVANRMTREQAEKVQELDLIGVSVFKEKWRFYPGEELAAHVLGFVGYEGDIRKGQYGLERYYNDILTRNDNVIYANFFVELFSGIGKTIKGKSGGEGSLVTTIEPEVQSFVEKEIAEVSTKWNSKETGVIVMDPKTGEIYTMALNPTFDLNKFNEQPDATIYKNSLVSSVYEMGSIIKPLTMAIGLDTDSVKPTSTYDDKGSMTLDGWTFYNFDKKARGIVDMQEVLNSSLNTGAAYVMQKTGKIEFRDYMKKLIGGPTGIDLPFEGKPLVDNLNSPRQIEYANASFGQGIALSPTAMIRALAALGNGGYLVQPHIVKEINYLVGPSKNVAPTKKEKIFDEKTSEDISRMLVKVVDEALLGGKVKLPHHTIAAKTGTAQIAREDGKGYYEDRFLHSFFGYFPAFDPKFIIFLYTVEPKGARYASETLTEPFMNMAKYLVNYYEVPPDR